MSEPITMILPYRVDLDQPIPRTQLPTLFATEDKLAHRFELEIFRGGIPISLIGATVAGRFIQEGAQKTVHIKGSVEDGKAVVTLDADCYAVSGKFRLVIKITMGGVCASVFRGVGSVTSSSAGAVIVSGKTVLTPEDLYNQIEAMKTATDAANAAASRALALIPDNLLDNSNFANPVNQRGGVMYSGTAGYKIDRWRSTANMSWIIASGAGISLNNNGTEMTGITQYVDDIGRMPLPGEKVTLACADSAGNIYCGSTSMPASGYIRVFRSADESFWGNVCAEAIDGESYTPPRVQLMLKAGAQIILKWAALYKGEFTAETLPPYRPKSYAQELAACSRYYWRSVGYLSLYGYTSSNSKAYLYLPLPTAMRTKPTVTLTGATLTLRGVDDTLRTGITINSATGMNGNILRIEADDSTASLINRKSVTATVSDSAGVLEVSAEP